MRDLFPGKSYFIKHDFYLNTREHLNVSYSVSSRYELHIRVASLLPQPRHKFWRLIACKVLHLICLFYFPLFTLNLFPSPSSFIGPFTSCLWLLAMVNLITRLISLKMLSCERSFDGDEFYAGVVDVLMASVKSHSPWLKSNFRSPFFIRKLFPASLR